MKKVFVICLLMIIACSLQVQAQKSEVDVKKLSAREKVIFQNAEHFYEKGEFIRALPHYLELYNKHPENIYLKFRTGICFMYKIEEKEKAVDLLLSLQKTNPDIEDIDFYVGKAYHMNYKFEEAIAAFKRYLKSRVSPEMRIETQRFLEYSKNSKVLTSMEVKCEITNIGNTINTEHEEYVPVISSDESVLIYTYMGARSTGGLMNEKFRSDPDGNYYEDVFISERVGDQWLSPKSIGENINTLNHDASIALSSDGQKLFTFHSTLKDGGDIFMSKLKGNVWSRDEPLGKNINTKYWEGSVSLSADEKSLYFASDRPGGLGGRDIYFSKLLEDGTWGPAQNLGPNVNTPFNDDSPFIHPDGITLFFSSEGHNSMGGYDIMWVTKKNGKFSEPTNMGYPINTVEDERFYVLSANGEHGYYSSNKKGGYGGQDIYMVSPGFISEKPILALVIGTITANEVPVDATIRVSDSETGEERGLFHSNSQTGKFLIALTPGTNYKIAIEVEGYESQIQYVNVKSLETYVQISQDFHFTKKDMIDNSAGTSVKENPELLQLQINEQIRKYNEERKVEIYEARVYQDILREYGEQKKECLSFFVELGTFEDPKDLDQSKLSGLGSIQSSIDTGGNTTFRYEGFKTILDAEIFRYKVMDRDTSLKNTIVTIDDCGKRKLIQQYYAREYTRKDYVKPTGSKIIKAKKGLIDLSTGEYVPTARKDQGNSEIAGLSYKVEIASLDNPSDFKLDHLSKYGKIESKTYPDGKTRFTFGPFKTLAEAEDFKTQIVEKEPEAAQAFVTVFYFGVRKTLEEFNNPCNPGPNQDFSFFIGKDLNNIEIYNKLIEQAGGNCAEGLIFRVQIGAYRKPQNFKHKNLNSLEPPAALVTPYPDGITRFTMRDFKTISEAEVFRQEVIKRGTRDAWITVVYNGERMLLQELIQQNFFNKKIN